MKEVSYAKRRNKAIDASTHRNSKVAHSRVQVIILDAEACQVAVQAHASHFFPLLDRLGVSLQICCELCGFAEAA